MSSILSFVTHPLNERIKNESNTRSVRIGGETINIIRFTDDIALCAQTEKDWQNILINVNTILWDDYGMKDLMN